MQLEALLLYIEQLTIGVQEYQEHPGILITSWLLHRNLVNTIKIQVIHNSFKIDWSLGPSTKQEWTHCVDY